MPFFTYSQNNSGGSFVFDDKVTHHVIIESESAKSANRRAEMIGIYFDGCRKGMDCPCCGDRWYESWDEEGTEQPEIYGEVVNENYPREERPLGKWRGDGPEIYVYCIDSNTPEGYWK